MHFLQKTNLLRTMATAALATTLSLTLVACGRNDAGDQTTSTDPKSPVAPAPTAKVTSVVSVQSGRTDLNAFERALARKFDPGQRATVPVSPAGGILHIPNGHVAHAMIVVRNPDGTLRQNCISSAAEASALVKDMRNGGGQ